MDLKEEATASDLLPKKSKQRRKRWKVWAMSCSQVWCFGAPHVEEAVVVLAEEGDVDAHVKPKAKYSRFWIPKAKRTVPVDASLSDNIETEKFLNGKLQVEMEMETGVKQSVQIPVAVVEEAKRSLFQRLYAKVHKKNTGSTGSNPQPPQVKLITGPQRSESDTGLGPVRASSPKPDTNLTGTSHRSGSPNASDPTGVATLCPISSPNCRKPLKPIKLGENSKTPNEKEVESSVENVESNVAGFLIVMFLVLGLLVGGRVFAIIRTCTCFYLIPSLRTSTTPESARKRRREKKNIVKIDYDSGEHKKRVVLEGLLERNGKRPVGFR